ncbi:MAG: 6-phosphogluconolactonase, partial [Actinomycetota bacterium]
PAAVHRLDPDAEDLDAECARFRRVVADGGLDLCLLGLGANGHVGLNEPGSAPDGPTRRVGLAPASTVAASRYGDAAPTWGLTLGMAEILEAREVWLLVAGAHKAAVLAEALEGPVTPALPASLLRRHERLRVLADAPAAAALSDDLRRGGAGDAAARRAAPSAPGGTPRRGTGRNLAD